MSSPRKATEKTVKLYEMSKTRIEVFKSQFIPDFKVFEVHIPLEYVKKLKDEN